MALPRRAEGSHPGSAQPNRGDRAAPFWRRHVRALIALAAILFLLTVPSYVINSGALRGFVERQMNKHLQGYTVRIGKAQYHPIGFSLDLGDLVLRQNANPEPPVADIERFHASVHWKEILRLHLVGDLRIDHPKLYLNLNNLTTEARSNVPIQKKGWQDAVLAVYPLQINLLRINGGEVTYEDKGPYRPLRVTEVFLHAGNIRNVESPNAAYPSPVRLQARIFDRGRLTLQGNADFLAKPHLGLNAGVELADMDLSYFQPILQRANINIRGGALSLRGGLEYSPKVTSFALNELVLTGADAQYVHAAQTAATEKQRVEQAGETARNLSNKPTSQIRIDLLRVEGSRFAYLNKASDHPYNVFIDGMQLTLRNFSNQMAQGPATFELTGRFMGSGPTKVTGSFLPETKTPNLDLNVAIEKADMTTMSDLFRAYGNFDIKQGSFSLYSEVKVAGDRLNGYVKPIFKNMKVTDNRTKKDKSVFHKMYVAVVSGVAELLQNRPRHQVATETDISGPLSGPHTNVLEIIAKLIQNAFIKAILPGFDKEVERPNPK